MKLPTIASLLAIPKIIMLNLKAFPLKTAIKLPIYCSHRVKIEGVTRDSIVINAPIKRRMIRIGMNHPPGLMSEKSVAYFGISKGAKLVFNGTATISGGSSVKVLPGGVLTIGDHFYCNPFCKILCKKEITIGEDNLWGWNITVNDGDGHPLVSSSDKTNERLNPNKAVLIGNHVWIGATASLLKGSQIPDNCVVAYSSVVLKAFTEQNCVIAGYPAKVTKSNVTWNH